MTAVTPKLKAPFPWFGGKSRVADQVWSRFGDVPNYVEPFAGSLAVLLGRPSAPKTETVNDINGYLCNFWRAVQHDPETVARWALNPVNECDLIARHAWLRQNDPARCLKDDPDYFDPKVAGWWVWGLCCSIGNNWHRDCFPSFPNMCAQGVVKKLPHLGDAGQGVVKKLPHLGDAGQGESGLVDWFRDLQARLIRVRVACGSWDRVTGDSVTFKHGVTGVFLDPPYSTDECDDVYRTGSVSKAVRDWAVLNGDNPKMRIALCGYDGEHNMPDDWECVAWKASGGMGSQGNGRGRENAGRERIWFSPHCLKQGLFGGILN